MLTLSLSLLLGTLAAGRLVAQQSKLNEKQDTAKTEAKTETPATTPAQTKEGESPAAAPAPAQQPAPPLPTIPPEVEQKLEAARRAVAEAIVAAQDAGLVDTTIDPPPILDILINGRATDKADLKAKLDELKAKSDASPEAGVSPEVFGAWFTGYGKMEGVTPEKNVRIVPPSKGLKDFYDTRAAILNRHIAEVRKARGTPAPAQPSTEPAAAPEAPKTGESKAAEESKPEVPKATEAPKTAEEPKGEEAKTETEKPAEPEK
jgi:hypothetical protein